MDYRLIAADIDGTLLNSRRELTPGTVRAVREAQRAGVLFTLCTGRPLQGIRNYAFLLSPDVPVITYNGAMVLTADTREILYERGLDDENALTIWREGVARDVNVIVWSRNVLYCSRINEAVMDYRSLTMETPHPLSGEEDFLRQCAGGITKMIWIADAASNEGYLRELPGILGDRVRYTTSNPRFLEFMNRDVSKSAALAGAAAHLGLRREQVIAVGDGLNDLDMIRWAGTGVAMGNASETVRNAADLVVPDNDSDGLACMVRRLITG